MIPRYFTSSSRLYKGKVQVIGMEYTRELQNFDLGELRKELYQEIENQKMVDQTKVKITGLLTNLLARIENRQKH